MNKEYGNEELGQFLEWRHEVIHQDTSYVHAIRHNAGNDMIYQGPAVYANKVDRYPDDTWRSLRQLGTGVLTPDPFATSTARPGGMRVWDALVSLPHNPAMMPTDTFRNVVAQRNCNKTWITEMEPSIRHAGPIQGRSQRPKHPWVFDLKHDPYGWFLLEAAHVLTHQRLDSAEYARLDPVRDFNPYPKMFLRAIAEIMLGLKLGIPINVSEGMESRRKCAHMPYGLDISATPYWHTPLLRFPWQGSDSPVFDKTVAIADVGVFLQPKPSLPTIQSQQVERNGHWACLPSMLVVAGWESVDVLARQQLVVMRYESGSSSRSTVMHPADLMPPETLSNLVDLGRQQGYPLPETGEWRHAWNWTESPEYAHAYGQTPPLPCPFCLSFNPHTEGNPRRPGKRPFKFRRPSTNGAHRHGNAIAARWDDYAAEVKAISKVIEKATVAYEVELHGGDVKTARRMRRERKAAHKAKFKQLKDRSTLKKAIHKQLVTGEQLGERERKALAAWQANGGDIIELANRRGRA